MTPWGYTFGATSATDETPATLCNELGPQGRQGGGGVAQGLGVGLLAAPTGLSSLCLGLES